jgi:cytosine/adenosine deaminase-related metal-dependent hydrolase
MPPSGDAPLRPPRPLRPLRLALAAAAIGLGSAGLLFFASLRPPPALEPPRPGVTLSDVTLIEPGGFRAEHRSLRVAGEQIAEIGPAAADPGDPLRGVFVLPGLNDLHVHFPPASIPAQTELFALLFLRHGVTAVRDAGDVDGSASDPARTGVAQGRFPGPRIFACGPFLDGEPPAWSNTKVVRTPDEARAAVEWIADAGFDCVKAYNELDAETLAAAREAAHRRGLPVIGHVPWRVPFEAARYDDMQHLMGVPAPSPGRPPPYPQSLAAWDGVDDARLEHVIAESLRLRIAHTPTLVTRERLAAGMRPGAYERLRAEPDARLLPRFYRDVLWNPDGGINPAGSLRSEADFAMVERALAGALRAVARMHRAGVELHSGSDTLISFVVPGAGLHRELRLFVQAGLTPEQALAVSTRSSADFLRVEGLGRLAAGAPAELALFREDPTRDLAALDSLAGVVRGGRLYTREALDADLARRRAHFESALFDRVTTALVRRAIASTRQEQD